MYRVHELTEGVLVYYSWHKISITKCPYVKICQLRLGKARSAVPFLAQLKTTSKTLAFDDPHRNTSI